MWGGGGYEYETNVLLEIKQQGISYAEERIQTIYIDSNQSSHFHPLLDSIKIYKTIFKFVLSSLSAFMIDIVVFSVLLAVLPVAVTSKNVIVLAATVGSRIISSLSNYVINKNLVFNGKNSTHALLKYYLLCVIQMYLSYGAVICISHILSVSSNTMVVVAKIITDSVLFFASYQIQSRWIFSSGRGKNYV